jgi:NADH-quinone oxidoreductase subunit L
MAVPLVLLAIPSVALAWFIGWPPEAGAIHRFLEPVFAAPAVAGEGDSVGASYTVQDQTAVAGSADSAAVTEEPPGKTEHVSPDITIAFGVASTIAVLAGIGLAYAVYLGRTVPAPEARPSAVYRFLRDKWRFDELYNNVIVQPLSALAMALWRVVDVGIIDAAVNGVAGGIGAASQRLRRVQTGLVTNYALAIALGMVLLVGIYLGLSSTLFR